MNLAKEKFAYPIMKKGGGEGYRFSPIASEVLEECEEMKAARMYKEKEWDDANHAYQAIVELYKNSFDSNVAPELQRLDGFRSKAMNDIKLPLEFAIIQRKLTYIASNLPQPKWLALSSVLKDSEKIAKGKQFTYIFDYVFYLCDGDWELFKTIMSSLIYGIGYISWFHEYYISDVEYPDEFIDGVLTYKTFKNVVSQTKLRNEDIRHILLDYNASDLRDIHKGAIIRHYDDSTFKTLFANNQFKIDGVEPISPSECFLKAGEERMSSKKKIHETIYFYDEGKDRFAIVVNGHHINPYTKPRPLPCNQGWSPIPSEDKKFPVAFFIDHFLDSELYAMGECRLAKPFREIKNKTRNMVFDVMKKVAFQTVIIDPLSDFNEDEYEFGQPFIRAEVEDVKVMPVSANLDFTNELDNRINEDISVFTGINILDTSNPSGNETATKTAAKRESQFAIIENYIKQNMSHGFKRMWLGMKNCIRLGYSVPRTDKDGNLKGFMVRTDGVKLFRGKGGGLIEQKKEGSFLFETSSSDYEHDMEIIPEMSNVAYTKELEDEKKREAIASLKAYPPQGNIVNLFALAELEAELGTLPKNLINPNPVQAPGELDLNQKPEDLVKNMDLLAKPPQYAEMASKLNNQVQNPEGITPSQRSPDAGPLPGIQPTEQGNPAVVA